MAANVRGSPSGSLNEGATSTVTVSPKNKVCATIAPNASGLRFGLWFGPAVPARVFSAGAAPHDHKGDAAGVFEGRQFPARCNQLALARPGTTSGGWT